jgi:hypothetical protein
MTQNGQSEKSEEAPAKSQLKLRSSVDPGVTVAELLERTPDSTEVKVASVICRSRPMISHQASVETVTARAGMVEPTNKPAATRPTRAPSRAGAWKKGAIIEMQKDFCIILMLLLPTIYRL